MDKYYVIVEWFREYLNVIDCLGILFNNFDDINFKKIF